MISPKENNVTDEKQEQPKAEAEDLKFVNQLFEELKKKKFPELLEHFERGFYATGIAALRIFEETCLNASNDKKRAEGAKYFLNLFRDADLGKNLALIHELRGRLSKGAATSDNKATWKNEPKKG